MNSHALTLWGLDDPRDLPKVHGELLAEECEYHDKLGMLQGWGFDFECRLLLVFEHGIAFYAPLWRRSHEVTTYNHGEAIDDGEEGSALAARQQMLGSKAVVGVEQDVRCGDHPAAGDIGPH